MITRLQVKTLGKQGAKIRFNDPYHKEHREQVRKSREKKRRENVVA